MNDDDGGYARHSEQFTGVTRCQVPVTLSVYKHTMTLVLRDTDDFGDNENTTQNHGKKLFEELTTGLLIAYGGDFVSYGKIRNCHSKNMATNKCHALLFMFVDVYTYHVPLSSP